MENGRWALLLYGATHGVLLLALYSISLWLSRGLIGVGQLPRKQCRRVLSLQTAISVLFIVSIFGELAFLSTGRKAFDVDLSTIIWGASWISAFQWGLTGAVLSGGGLFFYMVHWKGYRRLLVRVDEASKSGSAIIDLHAMQFLYDEVETLSKRFPPGLTYLPMRLKRILRDLMQDPSDEVLLRRVDQLLTSGFMAEALKWIIRWNRDSLEALILATECQDWKECHDLLKNGSPGVLGIEAAQLMADKAPIADYRAAAIEMMQGEENRRRIAGICYRHGDGEGAAVWLSDDWEAKGWLKQMHTVSRGEST